MSPIHELDIDLLSHRGHSDAEAEDSQLGDKNDPATTPREEDYHHMATDPSSDGSSSESEGYSTDEEDGLYPIDAEEPLGTPHILDPESREQLLLAIDRTPENRLRRAFEALASSVDDIPEGIFRMLVPVKRSSTGNAGEPQVRQEAVAQPQRTGDSHNHHQHQVAAVPVPGATHARVHQGPHNPGPQAYFGARPEPHRDLPRAAPYARPAYQVEPHPHPRLWEYPPHPQRLPHVPQQHPPHQPALGRHGALGAVNFPYYSMGPPARAPYEDVAQGAPRLGYATRDVAGSDYSLTGHFYGRYATTRGVERGYAPVYASPVPLAALPHAPDPSRAAFIPPRLVVGPAGPVPGARMHAPTPAATLLQASRAPAASGPSTRALPAGTRWDICANCRAEYDATRERLHGECEYHSGILEVNENMSDVVCVLADTNASRRSHPEKFVWTCCDRDGTRKGCEKGTHVPGAGQRRTKRARFE